MMKMPAKKMTITMIHGHPYGLVVLQVVESDGRGPRLYRRDRCLVVDGPAERARGGGHRFSASEDD